MHASMEHELTRINRKLTAILAVLALGVGLQIWQWAGGWIRQGPAAAPPPDSASASPALTRGGSPVIEIQGVASPSPSVSLAGGASATPARGRPTPEGVRPAAVRGVPEAPTNLLVSFHITFQGETEKPAEVKTLGSGKRWIYNDASATLTVAGSKKDYTEQRLWIDEQGNCTFGVTDDEGFTLPATASLLVKRKGYQNVAVPNIAVTTAKITVPDIIMQPSR